MNANYELDTQKFLDETGTTFKAKLLGNMPFFDDDTESRDVYEITLVRAGKKYVFRFGQSLSDSGEHRTRPTAYDVLACLTHYDPGTFEDFCGDFGYDTDSRKAEKTYFAVQKEWAGVKRLFGDVLERLQEIA